MFNNNWLWLAVYDNDPPAGTGTGAGAGGGQGGGGDGGQGGGAGTGTGQGGGQGDDDKPVISNKKMNAILAAEKQKAKEQVQSYIDQLEALKKSTGLTEKEKGDLEKRIEDLNNSLLSKDELAKKEKDKLLGDHKKERETLSGERDLWKTRYTESVIKRAISDGATTAEAFSPSQIVALLEKNARLVELLGEDGKPTGEFITKVRYTDKDDKGKDVTLDLTVDEAIKRMKETPDLYGNLFKATINGGLGGGSRGGGGGGGGKKDPLKMSDKEYAEWRKTQGLGRPTS